jgi:hypothetical protein
VVAAREAGDVTGVAQQLGGQHRAEPIHLGQGRAVLTDRLADGLAGRLGLPVQATHIRHQLASDALALDINGGDGTDLALQRGGSGGRELTGCPAGLQVGQQHVQPAQSASALGDQVVAAARQQPEDHRLVLEGDRAQPPVVDGGRGDRAGVGQVGLAALLVPSSRARAASLAGTSTTGSPAATSSWAIPRPRPLAPSTAQRRSGHCFA